MTDWCPSGSGDQLVVDVLEAGTVEVTDYDYTGNVAISPLCLLLVLEGGDWMGPSDAGDQPVVDWAVGCDRRDD